MAIERLSAEEAARVRRRLRRLARLLDTEYRLPGTRFRFGLDPLLGLLSGPGDLISFGLSAYIIYEARRLGVPRRKLVRMVGNAGLDAAVGTIPVLGDAFDFAFRANRRNLKLIEQELADPPAETPPADQV